MKQKCKNNLKQIFALAIAIFSILALNLLFTKEVKASTAYNSEISYDISSWTDEVTVYPAGKYITTATIPSKIEGKPVTKISGFDECKYLTNISIPNTVKSFDYAVFRNCTSLASITIPNSVTTIGNGAFEGCTALKSITIPSSVTEVESNTFKGCTSLKTVTINNGLKNISNNMFYGCTSLTSVTIPASVTKMGSAVFAGCTSLTSMTIPATVTEFDNNYFASDGLFNGCTALKSVTINAKAKELGAGTFKGCTSLTSVKLSDTIETIGGSSFEDCSALTTVTLPENLKEIEDSMFKNCKKLTTVNIKDNVEKVCDQAFENCTSLVTIKFPMGVKTINADYFDGTFKGCTALRNMYFTKTVQSIDSNIFDDLNTSNITIYGYEGTAAKPFATEKGIKFVQLTPVTSIKVTGASSVLKGSSIKLTATISPSNAYNKNVKWTSNNTSVATVDANGNVKGKSSGTATITAMAKDGTTVKGTYNVKVILTELPFKDINVNHWAYSAVKYVYNNNIIKGLNSTTFAPETKLSRGMMVTILYRMAGSPKVSGTSKFKDVKNTSDWYYNAVLWASNNKIASGYDNGNFGPNDNITREQLAVFLYKYAKFRGKNVSASKALTSFKDGNKVSKFATTQMKWATAVGVITGNNNTNPPTLNPTGTATRAEAASMLYKYCTKVGK